MICHGASVVQVELALLASVFKANAGFLAAIAVEWDLCVLEFEFVLWVDRVKDFSVNLHDYR